VIETEEMVVQSNDISFDDYIELRVFHLLLTIYFYEGNFEEAFAFAKSHGVRPFDLVLKLQSMLDTAPAAFRQTIDDFVRESLAELHDSSEACLQWARDHFDDLLNGTEGGNLLSKYSIIGRFFVTDEAIQFLHDAILATFNERQIDGQPQEALGAIRSYLSAVMLGVPFESTLHADVVWASVYDVETWVGDEYKKPLEAYRTDVEVEYSGRVPDERARWIQKKVDTFGEHPSGLGKFTRSMFARDMRRTLVAVH
jgi:hypothetical protein